ncbi:MAG: methenyltetrahydromethanopterin cyclohydrolase [Halobacteriaceae archaeon]
MESLNRLAIELADEAIDFADELNVGVHDLSNNATVIDFGVDHPGGIEAGLLLAELQTAGLATVQSSVGSVADAPRQVVDLATDHPALALLAAQKAGWEISLDGYEALGSGPARALVAEEQEYRAMGYTDAFDLAVLAVEADRLPTAAVADRIAGRADVTPESLYLLAYSTASLAGSVSAAARAAELAVFRLFESGYDPRAVRSAAGQAPVAPVATDEATAIARTTDALAYGGRVHLVVTDPLDDPTTVVSTAGETHGEPLDTVFDAADEAFEDVPASMFGPAQATIDVVGGPTHTVGATHEAVLADSFDT